MGRMFCDKQWENGHLFLRFCNLYDLYLFVNDCHCYNIHTNTQQKPLSNVYNNIIILYADSTSSFPFFFVFFMRTHEPIHLLLLSLWIWNERAFVISQNRLLCSLIWLYRCGSKLDLIKWYFIKMFNNLKTRMFFHFRFMAIWCFWLK